MLGDASRVRTQDVLKRLAALNADAYGEWSFIDLKRVLDGTGAEPYKSDGRMVVGRDRVARALANRDDERFRFRRRMTGSRPRRVREAGRTP